jgi:hypothetical protein
MTWVKMTEDWRRALDDNLVVGVVFVNFRKAFDSISPSPAEETSRARCIGQSLVVDKELSNRHQVTVINSRVSNPC